MRDEKYVYNMARERRQRNVWDVESSSIAIFKPGLKAKFSLRDASLIVAKIKHRSLDVIEMEFICLLRLNVARRRWIRRCCRCTQLQTNCRHDYRYSRTNGTQACDFYDLSWNHLTHSKYSDIWRQSGWLGVVGREGR